MSLDRITSFETLYKYTDLPITEKLKAFLYLKIKLKSDLWVHLKHFVSPEKLPNNFALNLLILTGSVWSERSGWTLGINLLYKP